MKLYGFPPSPNTWKVRAAAHQIGIPLQIEFVDLTKGDQRKPQYLALNPTGRTPTLLDDDFKLWESAAITHYLAAKRTAKRKTPRWPEDAKSRADIMRWQSWHLQHWGPAVNPFIFENMVKAILKLGEPDPKALALASERPHQEAAALDNHLARHPCLVNDVLTLADITVVAPLLHAEPAKIPLERYGNIKRWLATQAALPAWKETAPQR